MVSSKVLLLLVTGVAAETQHLALLFNSDSFNYFSCFCINGLDLFLVAVGTTLYVGPYSERADTDDPTS